MNSREFRIGNYAAESINQSPKTLVTITSISEGLISWSPYNYRGHHHFLYPLELDLNIISQLGFYDFKFRNKTYYSIGHFRFKLEFCELSSTFSIIDNERLFLTGIKYVHKLQNLWYDLTGEELIIEEI